MGRPPYAEERTRFLMRQVKVRHDWYVKTASKLGLSANEFICRVLAQFHARAEQLEIKQLKEVFKNGSGQG